MYKKKMKALLRIISTYKELFHYVFFYNMLIFSFVPNSKVRCKLLINWWFRDSVTFLEIRVLTTFLIGMRISQVLPFFLEKEKILRGKKWQQNNHFLCVNLTKGKSCFMFWRNVLFLYQMHIGMHFNETLQHVASCLKYNFSTVKIKFSFYSEHKRKGLMLS